MTPDQRTRLAAVLRRPGLPAAGDHARLMIEQQERREALVRARRSAPTPRQVEDQDPVWLTALAIALVIALFFLGLRYLP